MQAERQRIDEAIAASETTLHTQIQQQSVLESFEVLFAHVLPLFLFLSLADIDTYKDFLYIQELLSQEPRSIVVEERHPVPISDEAHNNLSALDVLDQILMDFDE
jgi:hypothetical protein